MKRILLFASLFILFTILLFSQEKPVVCVLELVNVEKNAAFGAICSTVRDTINLTLGTMGMYSMHTYTFTEGEEEIDIEDIDSIKNYSRQNKIDNVIFGSVFTDNAGNIVIELNVYDIRENKVTISERGYSKNLMGIFDASDELALSIMESFSGVHIVYGTIRIENSGFDGVYSVYIDGEFAGQNPMLIQDVFIGRHQLVVKNARMVGEHICYSEEVFIEEGMTLPVEISIPYLTREEMDEFKRLDTVILRNWGNPGSRDVVLESFSKALTILEVSPGLSCYDELRVKYESWQEEYVKNQDKEILSSDKKEFMGVEMGLLTPSTTLAEPFITIVGDDPFVSVSTAGILTSLSKDFMEEFDGPELNDRWFWVRENPKNWSLTERPDYMTITTQGGDLWKWHNDGKNILLMNILPVDFQIDTKLEIHPISYWHNAKIIIYWNDDNYVAVGRGFSKVVSCYSEVNGNLIDIPYYCSENTVYLRLVKNGNKYSGYFSTDGINFTFIGEHINKSIKNPMVGICCDNGDIKDSTPIQIPAYFDYFHLTYLKE